MCTGHVFIATSLDGFISREDHSLDWLPQEPCDGEDFGYDNFMEKMDGLIMGSSTFNKVLSFSPWPYTKPVIVLSHTLTEDDIPESLQDKVRVSNRSPMEIMAEVKSEVWQHVYVDGGQVIQSFLREGLIQELTITTVPILIGSGHQLFGYLDQDLLLERIQTGVFSSGLTQTRYRVVS